MMPILVQSDDVRSGREAAAHHGRLQAAPVSVKPVMGNTLVSKISSLHKIEFQLYWEVNDATKSPFADESSNHPNQSM